jgi:hypothetical protein
MKIRWMEAKSVVLLGLLVFSSLAVFAQETAKPKSGDRTPPVTPLRVQVVLSEFDGEKKVASLPYSLPVNSDERPGAGARVFSSLRDGARVPIMTGKDQQFTYIDIGTNMDCSATQQEDGRFKLQMTVERSSIMPDNSSGTSNPVVRQFKVNVTPILKDGQTFESVLSADPLSGRVHHLTVTLNVIK